MNENSATQNVRVNPELSSTEKSLAELWRETLQISDLPNVSDDFMALGGDSMTLSLLEFRIKEEFGVEISAESILKCDSLQGMATLIDSKGLDEQPAAAPNSRQEALPIRSPSDEFQK